MLGPISVYFKVDAILFKKNKNLLKSSNPTLPFWRTVVLVGKRINYHERRLYLFDPNLNLISLTLLKHGGPIFVTGLQVFITKSSNNFVLCCCMLRSKPSLHLIAMCEQKGLRKAKHIRLLTSSYINYWNTRKYLPDREETGSSFEPVSNNESRHKSSCKSNSSPFVQWH